MLDLGEETEEIVEVLRDLRAHGCDMLTLGQYLQPSRDHLAVDRFVTPGNSTGWRRSPANWVSVTSPAGPWCVIVSCRFAGHWRNDEKLTRPSGHKNGGARRSSRSLSSKHISRCYGACQRLDQRLYIVPSYCSHATTALPLPSIATLGLCALPVLSVSTSWAVPQPAPKT